MGNFVNASNLTHEFLYDNFNQIFFYILQDACGNKNLLQVLEYYVSKYTLPYRNKTSYLELNIFPHNVPINNLVQFFLNWNKPVN